VRVVVIGGGLAGITAAIALAESGAAVTLLEAKPRLGGATMSFTRDGLVVDTGQHVFLRCCTAYRGLLGRLGVEAHAPLQDRFDVTVLSPHGPARLRRTTLPWLLQMLPALARYRLLSFAERTRVSRAALAFGRIDAADPAVDATRLGDWLAAHGQDERTRRVLWDLFTVSSLNIDGDDASLALAATVVQTALLGQTGAADIGVPALPLGQLHGEAAQRKLAALSAEVRLNTKVDAILPATGRSIGVDATLTPIEGVNGTSTPAADAPYRVVTRDGGTLEADGVVLAVPHEAAAKLIPDGALPGSEVAGWAGLGAAPIVNVHVVYDRPVMEQPLAVAVDSPVQWVFDRTAISGYAGPGQYLAISLSAAEEYVDVPAASLREKFVPALAEVLPAARDARVVEFFVTRERRATFRQSPGSGRLRPRAATAMPGLVLAGAWTATGWPDTMEGAVRSGLNAALLFRGTTPGPPIHERRLGAPDAAHWPAEPASPGKHGTNMGGTEFVVDGSVDGQVNGSVEGVRS
jgi:squalene-associated FAD-dependent desaturase